MPAQSGAGIAVFSFPLRKLRITLRAIGTSAYRNPRHYITSGSYLCADEQTSVLIPSGWTKAGDCGTIVNQTKSNLPETSHMVAADVDSMLSACPTAIVATQTT